MRNGCRYPYKTAEYQNKLLGKVAQMDYTGGLDCLWLRLQSSFVKSKDEFS